MMRRAAFRTLMRPGASEIDLAGASEALARQAVPQVGPMIQDLLLLELRHTFETEAVNAAERAAGTLPGARKIAVAFADLAGFTRLGEALPPQELEHVASRLADLARDVAVNPVRFIKTIGDAVMLVCADPVPLLNAALDLVAIAAKEDLPYYQTVWQARRSGDMILIKTLLYTGVRVAELVAIGIDDVDLDACRIRITHGKGGKDRVVPFPQTFRETLALHIADRHKTGGT